MSAPLLIQLLRPVGQSIESDCAGQPARKRRAEQLLVSLLATAEVPAELEEMVSDRSVRGLRSGMAALTNFIHERSFLPEALCAHYRYRQSKRRVMARYHVSKSEWAFVHRLARNADVDMATLSRTIRYEDLCWHDTLEAEIVSVQVVLDPRALEDMVVSALEAYLSPKKRKGYEVFGINLGMARDVAEEKRVLGTLVTRYVSILRAQPQLSAEGSPSHVTPSYRSVAALQEAVSTLFPQHQLVGDFHSHVYADMDELRGASGWRPSDGDKRLCAELFDDMKARGHTPYVDFIVAIARCPRRVHHSHYRGLPNTLQTSVGNCRVVIGAHRILRSGSYTDRNTHLTLPGTTD